MNSDSPLFAVLLLMAMRGGPGALAPETAGQPADTPPPVLQGPPPAGPLAPAALQPLPLAPVTRPSRPRGGAAPLWQTTVRLPRASGLPVQSPATIRPARRLP